jgi:hypothetical protein
MSRSSLALYNLRGFVILIVVAFHSTLAYLGSQPATSPPFDSPPYTWKAIPIIDSQRWFGFDLFCASQYVYLMQFMFFLSGLFVWPSLLRKGSRTFLLDRVLRLGIPFVLGVFLLMPIAHYPVYRVTASDPSWSAFWTHWTALPFWPSGQLWFLWYLLALNFAVAGLYVLAPRWGEYLGRVSARAGASPGRYFAALVIVSALAYMPLAAVFRPWDWVQFGPFAFQPSFTLLYIAYFFAGVGLGAFGIEKGLLGSDGTLAQQWRVWAAGALAGLLTWMIPTAVIIKIPGAPIVVLEFVANLGFVLASVAACFALLAVFLRFATTRSAILGRLSENAYGIYLVHYPYAIWLQYALLGFAFSAIFKGAIAFSAALLLSWATIAAMCRIPIGARLMRSEPRLLARAPQAAKTRMN